MREDEVEALAELEVLEGAGRARDAELAGYVRGTVLGALEAVHVVAGRLEGQELRAEAGADVQHARGVGQVRRAEAQDLVVGAHRLARGVRRGASRAVPLLGVVAVEPGRSRSAAQEDVSAAGAAGGRRRGFGAADDAEVEQRAAAAGQASVELLPVGRLHRCPLEPREGRRADHLDVHAKIGAAWSIDRTALPGRRKPK